MRHVGQRLDVVDQGRAAVEALDRREWRLEARVAALSLQGIKERGLFATDVSAGATVDDQFEVVPGAEDVLAEVAGGVSLGDGLVEDVALLVVLAADEDEGVTDVAGKRGDRDSFDP